MSGDETLTLMDLHFHHDKRHGDLLLGLDRCVAEHAGNWPRRIPYHRLGNFITARWGDGAGARDDCVIASGSSWRRDQRIIELSTLHYPHAPKEAFGMGIAALNTPRDAGWGANVSLWVGGKTIISDGLQLSLRRYEDGKQDPVLTLNLGPRGAYEVHETTLSWSTGLGPLEELPHYLASAQALRDRGGAMQRALRDEVMGAIREKRVEGCDWGEYMNDGVPPPTTERPLTDEEEAAALAEAEAYFAARLEALDTEYEALFQALMETFPFKACWPG